MKVKTLRKHANPYPPKYVKNVGRKYELPERVGRNLIALGFVALEEANEAESQP